jgi:hypothetical protein
MGELLKGVRPRGTDSAKVMTVIVTESVRGRGTEDDILRKVVEVWTFDGVKIAEYDSVLDTDEYHKV